MPLWVILHWDRGAALSSSTRRSFITHCTRGLRCPTAQGVAIVCIALLYVALFSSSLVVGGGLLQAAPPPPPHTRSIGIPRSSGES
ncbi:hypothetical protein GDO78_021912 [Eleutherodactylus coqui]|uniref:Uncharacterized protein n=1 Tax=Eleutherodactylus coqui TaxID=57060 RepID=A0A8J6C517_ELECQ|nr:hypothetical protein GDO78_021912 [Eleutherodactylus coqui]